MQEIKLKCAVCGKIKKPVFVVVDTTYPNVPNPQIPRKATKIAIKCSCGLAEAF